MRLNEFDDSLSRTDLDNLEVFADKVFGKVGIDVNFTRHFLDRVNDERNIKQITKGELTRLFKQEAKRWAKPIARLGPDAEGTMKDLQTQINLPFVLVWDHNNQELDLIAKTVMRKKDFKTHNTEFPVESITEGDSAPGAGAIHHSEIAPTLQKLEQKLGIPLMKNALGSVGKKEFSGDIDIAVQLTKEEQDDFQAKLQSTPGLTFVQKTGVFITSADIVGYDDSKQADGKQRTGKVQIDFMPGDIEFMKHYYHSPHSKDMSQDGRSSNYKGVHRNLMVSAMIDKIDVNSSDETTPDGRPLEIERWMFSPTQGMVRVIRRPVEKKNGTGYTKANTNEVIKGPFKNPSDWAKILKLDNADDLYSFESLYSAAKKNYPSDLVQKVVSDFKSNPTIVKQGIPDEVKDDVK